MKKVDLFYPFVACVGLFLVTSSLQCTAPAPIDLTHLTGYWEIEFVAHKGEHFIPKVARPLYDYYHLTNKKGVRKKVAPTFVGPYETSEDQTAFRVEEIDGKTILHFKTLWDNWSEQIVYLDSTKLILFHQNNNYHYKRP